jgi:hypothetical protein
MWPESVKWVPLLCSENWKQNLAAPFVCFSCFFKCHTVLRLGPKRPKIYSGCVYSREKGRSGAHKRDFERDQHVKLVVEDILLRKF